jgi:hypothetical protein
LIHGFLRPYLQKKKKKMLAPELFLVFSTHWDNIKIIKVHPTGTGICGVDSSGPKLNQ